jgi:hypothetical protein
MQWEYAWSRTVTGNINDRLTEAYNVANEYGANGWEMVSFAVIPIGGGDINGSVATMYKRPLAA